MGSEGKKTERYKTKNLISLSAEIKEPELSPWRENGVFPRPIYLSSNTNALFPPSGVVRFGVIDVFPLPKVGQGPKICCAEPLLFSKLLCWGTKRIRKGAEKVELDTPVDDLSTESSLLRDRGMKTNRHTTCKVFLDNGGRKGLGVHLGRPPLLLFV